MAAPALLRVRGISKSFGSVKALSDIHADFFPGEIHAVLGENGAGKSTLMSILSGFLRPDSGSVEFGTAGLPFGNPAKIRSLGIAMVHQHFMLVPEFSVLENLMLDQLGSLVGILNPKETAERANDILEKVGWELNLSSRVSDLPVGVQQRIEILKALCSDAKVLILDEPTAVLSESEVEDLFTVLRRLRDDGVTIILIAHKLREVFTIADRCTVLRRGKWVGSEEIAALTPSKLAVMMVGEETLPLPSSHAEASNEAALVAENIVVLGDRGETAVKELNLTVRRGEILGVAGVDGNGQLELAEALVGIRPLQSGQIQRSARLQYIPQDRQKDGLVLSMSIRDNMLISGLNSPQLYWHRLLWPKRIHDWSKALAEQYEIKFGRLDDPIRSLSGGNQQKVLIARSFSKNPQLILLMNPTRGLDLKATRFVHQQLITAAARGCAVVLISSDRDELAALAHRSVSISSGRLSDANSLSYLGAEN